MGLSFHPASHTLRFEDGRIPQALAQVCSLARSASRAPDRLFWVSELQGGPALFSGRRHFSPRPEDLRAWLWESVASGAKAVLFWCFNSRDNGGEGGEWSLLDQLGRSSRRLEAVRKFIDELAPCQALLSSAKPPSAKVKILYSEASMLLSNVEARGSEELGNPRNREKAADALAGAYALFSDLGFEADFIDERLLREGGSWRDGTELLVLPGCVALEHSSLPALNEFLSSGGSLVADGLCGWKTPDAFIARGASPALGEIFGSALADIESLERPERYAFEGQGHEGFFTRVALEPQGGEVRVHARWEGDGAPAICERFSEKSSALRIGTEFFQRYQSFHDPEDLKLLRRLLPEALQPPLRLKEPEPGLHLRHLEIPGGLVYFLFCQGEAKSAQLVAGAMGSLQKPGARYLSLDPGDEFSLPLEPGDVKLLVFRTC
jgi:hypothetical protein